MFAALSADHKYLTIAVVNATESEQKFDLNVTGARLAGPSTLWQMTGSSLEAANHVGEQPQVEVKEIPIGDPPRTLAMAPITLNTYRFSDSSSGAMKIEVLTRFWLVDLHSTSALTEYAPILQPGH